MQFFYSFTDDQGDMYDAEFNTESEAIKAAEDDFADKCMANAFANYRNGDVVKTDIELTKFSWDPEGECNIVAKQKVGLVFEYYHGDAVEHCTYY